MLIARALTVIAPSACLSCRKPGQSLCLTCVKSSLKPRSNTCYRCHWGTPQGTVCIGCNIYTPLAGITVALHYEGAARHMIVRIKNQPDYYVVRLLAAIVTRRIMNAGVAPNVIVPIPTAPGRYRERGYNPAGLIAAQVARELRLPYRSVLLRMSLTHQIGQNRDGRMRQIEGAFVVKNRQSLNGAKVLLIDDVTTTGATLEEAARVLRHAGAASVWGAAVARH